MNTYQPKVYKKDNGDTLVIAVGGKIQADDGLGALPVDATLSVTGQLGLVHQTTIKVTGKVVAMTDHTTAGSEGHAEVYDFPAGNILILGAILNLTATRVGTAISATAALVASLGSTVLSNSDASLTGTEADLCPSSTSPLTAGTGPINGQSTGTTVLDGTNSAAKANLNLVIPDADSSGNDSLTISGTIIITWLNLGDN